ncbi:helix-turn-helix transcriptional regulator [Streptomyces chrestomyceticus]|uniref:helix-turn-helix transcriptional regulator n=1 Tax=Streptomyces chrestomyceticus TaxID=68185 RepID=UPI0033EC2C97
MPRTAQPGQLTPAELRCLARLADGLSTVDVANALGIQLTTLHRHMGNVRSKLGEGSYAHNLHRAYLTHQLALPAAVEAPVDFTPRTCGCGPRSPPAPPSWGSPRRPGSPGTWPDRRYATSRKRPRPRPSRT